MLQQARAAAAGALGARGAAVARGAGAGRGAGGRGAGGRGGAVGAPPGGVPTPATAAAAARAAVDTAATAPLSAAAAAVAAMRAPVEAVAKLHGLAAGSCPDLAFFATSFPLAIGRGAAHALPWASGAHCMVDADPSISRVHATLAFEPSSRTYEFSVLGRAGATVDGHRLQKGAVVRVGNGSCVRIGRAEFCVLMPARLPNPPPPTATLTLPAIAGAGTPAEPAPPLATLAEHAPRRRPPAALARRGRPLAPPLLPVRRAPVAQLCASSATRSRERGLRHRNGRARRERRTAGRCGRGATHPACRRRCGSKLLIFENARSRRATSAASGPAERSVSRRRRVRSSSQALG